MPTTDPTQTVLTVLDGAQQDDLLALIHRFGEQRVRMGELSRTNDHREREDAQHQAQRLWDQITRTIRSR